MAEPPPTGRSKGPWIIIILLLLVVLVIWLLRPSGVSDESMPAATPTEAATDFTVEPSGPAVPVTVPTTPMTNVPETPEAPAP